MRLKYPILPLYLWTAGRSLYTLNVTYTAPRGRMPRNYVSYNGRDAVKLEHYNKILQDKSPSCAAKHARGYETPSLTYNAAPSSLNYAKAQHVPRNVSFVVDRAREGGPSHGGGRLNNDARIHSEGREITAHHGAHDPRRERVLARQPQARDGRLGAQPLARKPGRSVGEPIALAPHRVDVVVVAERRAHLAVLDLALQVRLLREELPVQSCVVNMGRFTILLPWRHLQKDERDSECSIFAVTTALLPIFFTLM